MSLPKRLIPQREEILSTYLLRVSKANYYETDEFFKMLGFSSHNNTNHRIDIAPQDNLDISLAVQYIGRGLDDLLAMSFLSLKRKFIRLCPRPTIELLRKSYDVNRRFCPSCLLEFEKENQRGVYNRIWQISDVDICDKHQTQLISHCRTCGAKQPYITNALLDYECFKCGEKLYAHVELKSQISSDKLKNARAWQELISNDIEGLTDRSEIVYEVLIAITLLYLFQKNSDANIKDVPQEIISTLELMRIFNFVKFSYDYFVTPYKLLKYLNVMGMSVKEFFNVKVPDWFINKLIDYLKIEYGHLCYSERHSIPVRRYNKNQPKKYIKKGRILKATVYSITNAAKQLRDNNEPLTYKNVAKLAGISARYLEKRADFIKAIKDVKKNYNPHI